MFSTVRPTDMKSPYDMLLQNNVHFGSPDSRAGTNLKNVMARTHQMSRLLSESPFPALPATAGALQVLGVHVAVSVK